MINQILTLGTFTIALCISLLELPSLSSHFKYAHDNIYLLTAFFALFIFASLFNCFMARSDRLNFLVGLGKNRAFIFIMLLVGLVQIIFTYLGGSILRTAPLEIRELAFTMLLALSVVPCEFVRKLIWRLRGKKDGF